MPTILICPSGIDIRHSILALIDKAFPVLLDNLDDLGDALLNPLIEHWMKWERFKVQEHPDILGFNSTHNTPNKKGTLTVHLRILPAIFSFMEALTLEREDLYRQGRLKLLEANITVDYLLKYLQGGSRHIFPFDLDVTGTHTSGASHRGIHLPRHFASYVESVVGNPSASLDQQNDRLDWHPSQFGEALESYIVYSKDEEEVDQKILDLLHRYEGVDGRPDVRRVLLRSPKVQRMLWARESLSAQVSSWLPQYPILDGSQDIDFDPLPLMPPRMDIHKKDVTLITLREPVEKEEEQPMLKALLLPFSSGHMSIRGASINTTRKLAVFLVAWILTILKVPRDETVEGDGPVHYAIRKVRLSQAFVDACKKPIGHISDSTGSLFPCRLLHLVLPVLSLSEISDFARIVFSVSKTPATQALSIAVLKSVRSLGIPHLAREQAFSIFEDVEASSWHRQVITPGIVNHSQPQDARALVDRILVYTQERHRLQKERRKGAPIVPSGTITETVGPLLKMSTHKMVMQLLQVTVRQGSLNASFVEICVDGGLLETPSPIISYVVDVLAGLVQDSFIMAKDGIEDSETPWRLLAPFVSAAQRLSEEVSVSEMQWDAARVSQAPMPDIVEECHIAASLLSRDVFSLPSSLKQAWAKNVVEPVIVGHIENRTRWLKTAVAREGGSSELEATMKATYGARMPVVSSFKVFAPHLPPPETSLLQLLEHQALGFLFRDSCQKLRDLVNKNHPEDWKREPYGKTIVQLTSYAVSDATSSGSSVMSTISDILSMPNMPHSLIDNVTSSLKYIGLTLLRPEYMLIHADMNAIVPFSSFTRFVTTDLAAPSKDSLEPGIVALLSEFLTAAENYEQQKSNESLNGGACYWRVILILKVSLSNPSPGFTILIIRNHSYYHFALLRICQGIMTPLFGLRTERTT